MSSLLPPANHVKNDEDVGLNVEGQVAEGLFLREDKVLGPRTHIDVVRERILPMAHVHPCLSWKITRQ